MPLPLAIPAAAFGLGLLGKGFNYFTAGSDKEKAQEALDELSKQPYAQYKASPELLGYYSMALGGVNNAQGLSGGERAAFRNDVNSTVNTQYQNAVNTSGGNMSRFIRNALNPSVVSASNRLVGQDAQLRRQNRESAFGRLASATSAIQGINDRNVQEQLRQRYAKESALGQAVLQNKAFQTNTLDSFATDLLGGGLQLGMGYFGDSNSTGYDPGFNQEMNSNMAGNRRFKINTGLQYGLPQ